MGGGQGPPYRCHVDLAECIRAPGRDPVVRPEHAAPSWDCLDVLDTDDDLDVDLDGLQTFQLRFATGGVPGD